VKGEGSSHEALPIIRVGDIRHDPVGHRWLVENLWSDAAVGIIGGPPKCCKTWLALDLAFSVATGTPCLGTYEVLRKGNVLLYAAEDSLEAIRQRLDCIASSRNVALETVPIFALTVDSLRLDRKRDRDCLERTLSKLSPRLLVLDPLIRLHRLDENSASEISGLLGFLRELQRRHDLAVMLVHHARKAGHNGQAGQALRGSGDLHAFGDSNLYLRRKANLLILTIEHRSAASPEPKALQLVDENDRPHLVQCCAEVGDERVALRQHVLELLREASGPLRQQDLRDILACRNQTLTDALQSLRTDGLIDRSQSGWQIAT